MGFLEGEGKKVKEKKEALRLLMTVSSILHSEKDVTKRAMQQLFSQNLVHCSNQMVLQVAMETWKQQKNMENLYQDLPINPIRKSQVDLWQPKNGCP